MSVQLLDGRHMGEECVIIVWHETPFYLFKDPPTRNGRDMDMQKETKRPTIKIAPKTDRYICLMNFTWVNIFAVISIILLLLYCGDRQLRIDCRPVVVMDLSSAQQVQHF